MSLTIDPASAEPPFEQVRRQVAALAADGTWEPGHRLPTVRGLAEQLDLAVNTVAKAYKALEADGVVETLGRRGTIVARRHADDTATRSVAVELVRDLRRRGLSRDEAHRLLDETWDR